MSLAVPVNLVLSLRVQVCPSCGVDESIESHRFQLLGPIACYFRHTNSYTHYSKECKQNT